MPIHVTLRKGNKRKTITIKNPELKAKRSVEFEDFGTYDVVLPDGRTAVISRDVGGTGWWYISWSGLHYSQCLLGFNKKEALENLEQKIAVMEHSHGAMPVYQHAKKRNPKGRRPKITPEQIERLRFLYTETNMNASQIARSVGVSVGTAQKYSVAQDRTRTMPHIKPGFL